MNAFVIKNYRRQLFLVIRGENRKGDNRQLFSVVSKVGSNIFILGPGGTCI